MVPELANESFGVVLVVGPPVFAERALYSNANGTVFCGRRRSDAPASCPDARRCQAAARKNRAASTVLLSAGLPR